MDAPASYRFGEFSVDVAERTLTRDGARVSLAPKTFDLLVHLVTHPGTLLTKQALLDAIWGSVIVTENSLTQAIHQLRTALGDTAEEPRYVETVPRSGYRFVARVEPAGGAGTNEAAVVPVAAPASPRAVAPPRRVWPAVAAAIAVVLFGGWWWQSGRTHVAVSQPAIAVLPFANMSSVADNEFLSDGIAEEILDRLSQRRELRVMARTSSFAFKDSKFDVPKLSDILGVDYILEGSVRNDGRQIRIAAQLVDSSGHRVWSKTYDRGMGDVFAIQNEIADAVVASIAPQLAAIAAPAGTPPDVDAYVEFLIGREIQQRRLPLSPERALPHFERAIELDPAYADAYVELALARFWSHPDDPEPALAAVRSALETALSLEPELPRAHALNGLLLIEQGDRAAAEVALQHALALDPNLVDARIWLNMLMRSSGRNEEAWEQLLLAARVDPLAGALTANIASFEAERGDIASAEQRLRRALQVPQPPEYVRQTLIELLTWSGRLDEAVEVAKDHVLDFARQTGKAGELEVLAQCYSRLGMWHEAEKWQRRAETGTGPALVVASANAAILSRRGEHTKALETFERALATSGETLYRSERFAYGTQLAFAQRYEEAVRVLTPGRPPTGWQEAAEAGIDAAHSLVWARQRAGSGAGGDASLQEIERWYAEHERAGLLHLSIDRLLYARNALLMGDPARALTRLQSAVDAGWRDYYWVANDPRWGALHDDPAFQAQLARIKADVDLQRGNVERVDASDDTAAHLDVLVGAGS